MPRAILEFRSGDRGALSGYRTCRLRESRVKGKSFGTRMQDRFTPLGVSDKSTVWGGGGKFLAFIKP